jgi:uncharacterized protein (DUF952 family)
MTRADDLRASAQLVYKLLSEKEWLAAVAGGNAFHGTAKDLQDGYIHLSEAPQVPEIARPAAPSARPPRRSR